MDCSWSIGCVLTTVIGLNILYKVALILKNHVLSKIMGMAVNIPSMGSFAVVTGSTDGIGKAYAEELARLGLNIVLIGRSADKLKDVSESIEERFKVKTKSVIADFGKSPGDLYASIEKGLEGIDIAILVNNVGVGMEYPDKFMSFEDGDRFSLNMINVNMTSAVMMTRLVLPRMEAKHKGIIVNVGSASGLSPLPRLNLYAATKAFVSSFSESLSFEYAPAGVIIQTLMPYFVCTKLSGIKRPSFLIPDPTSYVQACLLTIGRESYSFGCLSHALQGLVNNFLLLVLPLSLVQTVSDSIMAGAKAKFLKRRERLAAADAAKKSE